MENLKPNDKRARNAIALIWIVFILEIASLISGYFQYTLLQIVVDGGEISEEAATLNDRREQIIGITYMVVFIISAVTFIQWFRRAYYNLHTKVGHLSQSEGWAAASWFVPIISLFRPYYIMKELYQETKALLLKKGLPVDENFTTSYLSWWWLLWIINNILGQIVFRFAMHAKSLGELTDSTSLSMLSNVIGIPLALVTVKVIRDYSNVEPLLYGIGNEVETSIREEEKQ